MTRDKAYFYGVFLGDGFLGKARGQYRFIALKAVDPDFVRTWRDCVERLYGKELKIYTMKPDKPNRQSLYLCKFFNGEVIDELRKLTHEKTEIPNFVHDGDVNIKKAFIQGLMDSEGYVKLSLSPIKQNDIGVYFAATSSWVKDLWHIFSEIGIEVSKIHIRKFKDGRKNVYWFKINILDYIASGLTFNIERKRKRLRFISEILNDYTRNYKGRRYSLALQETVS